MNITVVCIVLLAAALHATWNAIVKRGGDTLLTTVLVTGPAALIAAVGLPFLPSSSAAGISRYAGRNSASGLLGGTGAIGSYQFGLDPGGPWGRIRSTIDGY